MASQKRRRLIAATSATAVAAAAMALLGATGSPASAAAPQSYDLTTGTYCTAATGKVTPALNANLISNSAPTANSVTARSAFFPGTTKTAVVSGSTTYYNYLDGSGNVALAGGTDNGSTSLLDPGATLLPDCWVDSSSLAANDPKNEIAMMGTSGGPGALFGTPSGKPTAYEFYGGNSANDAAATGTATSVSQTIDLSALGAVDGQPFTLAATLGGYTNQTDNTVMTATWMGADGARLGATSIGPDMPADRDNLTAQDAYSTTGVVPAGATKVQVDLTFTHGGAGNNDASATVPYLAIGPSPTFSANESDFAAPCADTEKVAPVVGQNLIANPSAESVTSMAPTSGPTKSATTIPDCWTAKSGYFAQGVVPIAQVDRDTSGTKVTSANAATSGYFRVDDPHSDGGHASASNYHVFYGGTGMNYGAITTDVQVVDLTGLTDGAGAPVAAAGLDYALKGWLGGYQTQADFASVTVAFRDAAGAPLGSEQIGPVGSAVRTAYGKPNGSDNSMLLPLKGYGTVPAGATTAVVTIAMSATGTGNDDGMADDISLVVGGDAGAAPTSQRYDATDSQHCPAADQVTPALDANLIENAGAEDYSSAVAFGANGDSTVTVPDCWVSYSNQPEPEAVAESYAQTGASYPSGDAARDASSKRVFWGGTNPDGGIAGVSTYSSQTIDLSGLDADGKSYKLSGLLGGYSTQDDNALVTADFLDADGNSLTVGTIGPVKAGQRGSVSSLVAQGWYGEVPAGAVKVVVTIKMTAVSTGNDLNGEADNLSLVIGDSTTPTGPILQTLPYDALGGGDAQIDPTTGLVLPPAGGLYRPAGVSAADGVVYASNTGDNVLASMHNGGSTVIAGTLAGYGDKGDGGPATDATLYQPGGTAVDAAGDVYIADSGDNVVREIKTDGSIVRVAGTGTAGNGTVTATSHATDIALNRPMAVAVDADGDLFVADTDNQRVLEIEPGGAITQVAGTGKLGYGGDGGPATSARLAEPSGIAVDSSGNLYVADAANNLVRRVDAQTGHISTVAGDYTTGQTKDGLGGFSGDGGPATSAELNDPQGVALDGAGDLFIADTFNNAVREVSPDGTITTAVNTTGAAGGESSGVAPGSSKLNSPYAVAVDPSTSVLYIADTKNSSIAEVIDLAEDGTAAGPTEPAQLLADQAKLEADRATLSAQQSTLAADQAILTTKQGALTTAQGVLAAAQAKLAADQGGVTSAQALADSAQGRLSADQGTLVAGEATLATAQARLASVQHALTADEKRLKADRKAFKRANGHRRARLKKKIAALTRAVRKARSAVTSGRKAVVTDQQAVTAAQAAVTADQNAVISAQPTVTTGQSAVTADQAAVTAAQAAVTADQAAVAAAQAAVTADQNAITATETAVAADQAAVGADQ